MSDDLDPKILAAMQGLFTRREMFNDPETLQRMGFEVKRNKPHNIMVIRHASIEGYLFKKYANEMSTQDQLDNYTRRLEGARALRSFINEKQLHRLIVPMKWLRELPFHKKNHVLVVERMSILNNDETSKRYRHIDDETLKELCTALFKFKGLDSAVHNVPFTADGKIAFIDTESRHDRRGTYSRRVYPRLVEEHLSGEVQKRAIHFLRKMEPKKSYRGTAAPPLMMFKSHRQRGGR